MSDIYVVVADNDKEISISGTSFHDDGGKLIFETYVNKSSLDEAIARINMQGGRYGRCRIAKLVFIQEQDDE